MSIQLVQGGGGLPKLVLTHPAGGMAEVYLHGAQVTSWVPASGREVLFLSRASAFAPGSAIRGGIPVIFPQFADRGPLPKHGFARTHPWQPRETADGDDVVAVTLELRDTVETRAVWPFAFAAALTVELAARQLEVRLAVSNPGPAACRFTAALHTYLRVEDVRRTAVEGLQGVRYRSTPEGAGDFVEAAPEVVVTGEVDRIYLDAPPALQVHDRAAARTLRVLAEGFRDVVVWNPWIEKAAALPDLADEEYREMICVEAAQVGTPVELAPGAQWRGAQRLQLP